MKNILKKFINFVIPFAEILYLPLLVISGLVMWLYRSTGSKRLKLSTKILRKIGIFPIRDHYYEPLFNDAHLSKNLKNPRNPKDPKNLEDLKIKKSKDLKNKAEVVMTLLILQ